MLALIKKRKKVITLPNIYTTDVLNDNQIEYLASKLPCPCAQTGRPGYSNKELLPGILMVLRSGCRWRDLDQEGYPSGVTHWRRLRFWGLKAGIKRTWERILLKLNRLNRLDLSTASVDGSLIQSFEFKDTTGFSGKHHQVGTKISTIVDFEGTPFNVVFAPGNRNDVPLAIPTITDNPVGKPNTILTDKGYDSDKLRLRLNQLGIFPNIPSRELILKHKRRKGKEIKEIKAKYNQNLNRMRFRIERTNAWIKSFRRLHFRFDYTLVSFQTLTYLALIVICLRKLIP